MRADKPAAQRPLHIAPTQQDHSRRRIACTERISRNPRRQSLLMPSQPKLPDPWTDGVGHRILLESVEFSVGNPVPGPFGSRTTTKPSCSECFLRPREQNLAYCTLCFHRLTIESTCLVCRRNMRVFAGLDATPDTCWPGGCLAQRLDSIRTLLELVLPGPAVDVVCAAYAAQTAASWATQLGCQQGNPESWGAPAAPEA